jgi:sugar/nucleoside kinase (ribokinase family)
MNFWIGGEPEALKRLLTKINLLVINESEARLLSGENNLFRAVEKIKTMGPSIIVVKQGGHGAALFHPEGRFFIPAYPLTEVVDPTGAGDSFASGMVGYLAKNDQIDFQTFKKALLSGTVMASFACEGFSFDRVATLTEAEIEARCEELKQLISLG